MDTQATITTGLALLSTKDLLLKILGPICDSIGKGVQNFLEERAEVMKRICSRTKMKLGNTIEIPGSVPFRVWKEILEAGSLSTDGLLVEYYSGLLATSRTASGKDDRVLPLLSLLKSMSTYQVRMHYIFYYFLHSAFLGREINIMDARQAQQSLIFIPFCDLEKSMSFDPTENAYCLSTQAIYWLVDSGLLSKNTAFGNREFLIQNHHSLIINQDGVIVGPSPKGAELFLAIHNLNNNFPGYLFTCPKILPCEDIPISGKGTPIH